VQGRLLVVALLIGALPLSVACHTMTFQVADGPAGVVVKDRKSFYLGGLVPTKHVDVAQFCPNGAVAITEEISFVDGLLSLVTLSIYTPRSSYYECSAGGQ
jgi:Bor protein